MKKIFVLILFISLAINTFSQKLTISPPVNIRNDNSFEVIRINNSPVVLRYNNNEFILDIFDQNLTNFSEKKILFEKRNSEIVSTSANDNNLLVFYSYEHKGDELIKVVKINENGTKSDSAEIYKASSSIDSYDFKNTESEDGSKTVLFRSINSTEMDFIIFDNFRFKKLYSKRIKFKELKTNTDFRKIEISNDGEVFVIFQKLPGIFNKYNNKIIINKIDPNDQNLKKKELDVEFYFDNFKIVCDNKNRHLIIAGTRNKLFQNKSEGYFTIKLNSELELLYIRNNPFSKGILEMYYKTMKSKNYINNLKVKEIIPRNDGGFVLSLEKVEIITRQSNNDFRMRYQSYVESTDNIYGEIILISVHENGDEFWARMISKNQVSSNDEGIYSSFGHLITPGRINIVFNDEIKDETQVIMYNINPVGNIERISLFNTELYDLKLLLRESIQLSNKNLLIPSYNKDKLKIVMLELVTN